MSNAVPGDVNSKLQFLSEIDWKISIKSYFIECIFNFMSCLCMWMCVHADVSSKCVIPSLYLVERHEAGRREGGK